VRIGTLFGDVVSFAGGASDDCRKVIAGGPMTGIAQATLDVPVTKATTGIILLKSGEVDDKEAGPCIRCGRCVDGCPMRLMPNDLSRFVENDKIDLAESYGVQDCIECGVCAYVCPSRIRHVYFMKRGKSVLAARRQAA
jgi:electron transport complex protein RnfC